MTQDEIVNYLKNYGFIYQGSSIYNGLANSWDYGPIGVLLKNNLKNLWWNYFVTKNKQSVGLDSSIILNPSVWKASGHISNFSDPLIDCKNCHQRFRADKLIEEFDSKINISESTPLTEIKNIIDKNKIKCPSCGNVNWTEPRKFNLMFKTYQGVLEDDSAKLYLRPETAQGIFINFGNIQRSSHMKLPFCVCQIGKAFRNEITPGNFIFRTREFEQMEIEYFCKEQESASIFETMLKSIQVFLLKECGINKTNIKLKEHDKNELSHYSSRTIDIQYNFPHGFSELWGIANRTNYDLTQHINLSKSNSLYYQDPISNEKIIPHIVEPSVGCDRLLYAIICDSYKKEKVKDEVREILSLSYNLCPYKASILSLTKEEKKLANKIFDDILKINNISISIDDSSASIGKKYRRQDAIGTYYCLTVDSKSTSDKKVTIRNRDNMKQKRIPIKDIYKYISIPLKSK